MIMDNFFFTMKFIYRPLFDEWPARANDEAWCWPTHTHNKALKITQGSPTSCHPQLESSSRERSGDFYEFGRSQIFSDFCSYSDFQLSSLFIHWKLQMGAGMLFVHLGEFRSWSHLVWTAMVLSSELQTFSSAAKWVQLGRCNWRRSVGVRHWLQLLRTLRVLTRAHHHPASQHPSSYPSSTHTHTHISIYPPHAHTNIYI